MDDGAFRDAWTGLAYPAAVVCHDAGAANHVLAWIAAGDLVVDRNRVVVAGPALRLWLNRFGAGLGGVPLERAIAGAATLVSGTGWASDLEHRARRLAIEGGVRTIAVVDHWVNYGARFERDGVRVLPDEIWVTDDYALQKAVRLFPGVGVLQQPNRYLDEQVSEIGGVSHAGDDVLVVMEPARSTWGRDAPGEFQALDYLVEQIGRLGLPPNAGLRLRPHPSDPAGKYDRWLSQERGVRARLDDAPSLAAAISRCRIVAGCESAALIVALAAGRRVVCTLPPWAPPSRLPHSGIVQLAQQA